MKKATPFHKPSLLPMAGTAERRRSLLSDFIKLFRSRQLATKATEKQSQRINAVKDLIHPRLLLVLLHQRVVREPLTLFRMEVYHNLTKKAT